MPEYIVPHMASFYEDQDTAYTCWAAVAHTMLNKKSSRKAGKSFFTILRELKNKKYLDIFSLIDEGLSEYLKAQADNRNVPADDAINNIRLANPARYKNTPTGLPSSDAKDFFVTNLGMKFKESGPGAESLDMADPAKMLAYIKSNAPMIVFSEKPSGHLRIIIGYWYDGESTKDTPQIILFDPEAIRNGDPHREQRKLWEHYRTQVTQNLAAGANGVFHW